VPEAVPTFLDVARLAVAQLSSDGMWHVVLTLPDGEVFVSSETFATEADAVREATTLARRIAEELGCKMGLFQ
jgi:hypothetical protein